MFNLRKVGLMILTIAIIMVAFDVVAWAQETADKTQDNGQLFSALIDKGKIIFKDLRELVYIAAGFGFIAVGVGGIFGNLNWKWLGAIIISLVVIATAGEIIVWMTGKSHGIGRTLQEEKAGIEAQYQANPDTFEDTMRDGLNGNK